jgi:DNA primase
VAGGEPDRLTPRRGTVGAVAIPDDDVARVRAATDMVALIGEHVALKRQGRRWVGLCPFHSERTPSFAVNAEEGLYHCFGCQRSGDAITFVRETEHLDFAEAVRRLADRAGLTITEDPAEAASRQRRAPLAEAMARAVDFYHQRLLRAPDAGPARQYLRTRGYDAEVVRRFQLGWAPDDWDQLARHLAVPDDVLVGSGLGFRNRRGRQQDAFRARVLFPIFDPSGHPIAFGGRVLPAPDGSVPSGPKYKNSPDGPLYAKRRVLYGLNWAKHDVVASGEVVVCEGYTDVIGCFVAGVPRAVATCGTALGEEHFRLLANFADRIVLAYDADSAGQAGAGRVHEWARGQRVDVVVAVLPDGADPGDLARHEPEALRAAVAGAVPMVQFQIDRVLGGADLRHPEGRAAAAEMALAAVAEHPVDLVRDQYLMQVADRCHLDHRSLRAVLDRLVGDRRTGARPARPPRVARGGGSPSGGGGSPSGGGGLLSGGGGSPSGGGGLLSGGGGSPSGGGGLLSGGGSRPREGVERSSAGTGRPPGRTGGPAVPVAGGAGPIRDGFEPADEHLLPVDSGGSDSHQGAAGSATGRALGRSVGAAAGLEALRLAVHDPEQVAHLLEPVLFLDTVQRVAFEALVVADDLHLAIERAERCEPAAADLLRRVAVEEPTADGASVAAQLVRVAARVALRQADAEARRHPERFAAVAAETTNVRSDLQLVDEEPPDEHAVVRLVAWLGRRAEEGV